MLSMLLAGGEMHLSPMQMNCCHWTCAKALPSSQRMPSDMKSLTSSGLLDNSEGGSCNALQSD